MLIDESSSSLTSGRLSDGLLIVVDSARSLRCVNGGQQKYGDSRYKGKYAKPASMVAGWPLALSPNFLWV